MHTNGTTSPLSLLIRFHLLVRREGSQARLSLTDGQLIGEILSRDKVLSSDLSSALKLEQSSVSRLVNSLKERGFVCSSPNPKDKRKHLLSVSAKGRKELEKDDLARSNASSILMSCISAQAQTRIIGAFRNLSDTEGIDRSIQRPNEHPLRPEQRRLTRAFGLLRGNFMGTGLSISCFHIFHFLIEEGSLPLSFLFKHVPYEQSSISRAVEGLVRKRLIKMQSSVSDLRARQVTITSKGQDLFASTEKALGQKLKNALDAELCAEFLKSLQDFFALNIVRRLASGKEGLAMRQLSSSDERGQARGLLVSNSVAHGRLESLPALLYPDSARAMGLFKNDLLIACCELLKVQHQGWQIRNEARNELEVPACVFDVLLAHWKINSK